MTGIWIRNAPVCSFSTFFLFCDFLTVCFSNAGYNWNSWKCRYNQELSSNVTASSPLLLGGEGAMWGEGINRHNFDAYVWHGSAAIAERLWSDAAATKSVAAAQPRLAEHMCTMELAGFQPGPIFPGFCMGDV